MAGAKTKRIIKQSMKQIYFYFDDDTDTIIAIEGNECRVIDVTLYHGWAVDESYNLFEVEDEYNRGASRMIPAGDIQEFIDNCHCERILTEFYLTQKDKWHTPRQMASNFKYRTMNRQKLIASLPKWLRERARELLSDYATNLTDMLDWTYFTYDDFGFMGFRTWKDTFWEGDNIAGEPKVTHWTIVQPPCV